MSAPAGSRLATVVEHLKSQLLIAAAEADRCDRLRHYGEEHQKAAEFYSGRASGLRAALDALKLIAPKGDLS